MENKEIKKGVVKRKINITKVIIFLLVIYIISFTCYKIVTSKINNIYVSGNKYLSIEDVITSSGIGDYPSFILTSKYSIKKNLLNNNYIENVKIKKRFGNKVFIEITEYKPLFVYNDKLILSSGKMVDDYYPLPTLHGNLEADIVTKLVNKYKDVDEGIRNSISEIKYDPNDIDKERFLIIMNDGNYVYITLYKLSNINQYFKIVSEIGNINGILYLDSGNYFETFK